MSFLRDEILAFLAAVTFFTRIPVPGLAHSAERLNRAARYFPLVGWIVGGAGALAWLAAGRFWPEPLPVVLSTIVTILLTGAFHEDGWADFVDGFGGGTSRERVLEIMKDSRIGTFGAVALVAMLATKVLALASLSPSILPWALLAGHASSRFAATVFLRTHSYVREDLLSKSKPLATALSTPGLLLAAVFGLLPSWPLGIAVLPALAASALAAGWIGRMMAKRLGGYTGDCLGAAQQCAETAFYLGLSASAGFSLPAGP